VAGVCENSDKLSGTVKYDKFLDQLLKELVCLFVRMQIMKKKKG